MRDVGIAPELHVVPLPAPASFAERISLHILQAGAVAIVLAASTYTSFDLDRFFIPKEFVLHLAVLLSCLLGFRALRRISFTRVDLYLTLYLVLGALSAALATNGWNSLRALAITASGIAAFWLTRGLAAAGLERNVLRALSLAVAAVAATALLQTYGLRLGIFSLNRAPGGTLGNRNFVAHAAAFGFPFVLLAAFEARRRFAFLAGASGAALVVATLVLTRSRAAWLAFAAVAVVFLFSLVLSPALRRDGRSWRRLFAVIVLSAIAVAAAITIPNTLRWRSDNPYLESAKDIANYQEGSGRGRLIQYERSLRMALHHPLFGVGPGNWSVEYAAYATGNDPSLDPSAGGMTYNPWPSSDWVAFVAERGPASTVLLALAFLSLLAAGLRRLVRAPDADSALVAAALIATIAGAGVTGLFDAVLLLALPSYLVWTGLGALSAAAGTETEGARPTPLRGLAVLGVLLIVALGLARSSAQLYAMDLFASHGDRTSLERASDIDPGSYRLHLRLARGGKRATRCEHARAAHDLYPNASAAKNLARGCK